MKKPTLFVQITDHPGESPIAKAIKLVATTLTGCVIVDKLVDENDVEADVAIIDGSSQALRFIKETEKTTVIVTYLTKEVRREAEALATRYPGRIHAWCYVEPEGEPCFVLKLATLIKEKAKVES